MSGAFIHLLVCSFTHSLVSYSLSLGGMLIKAEDLQDRIVLGIGWMW